MKGKDLQFIINNSGIKISQIAILSGIKEPIYKMGILI